MLTVHFSFSLNHKTHTTSNAGPADHVVALHFTLGAVFPPNRVHQAFTEHLRGTDVTWITPLRTHCVIDLDAARRAVPALQRAEWMQGIANIEPDIIAKPNEGAIGLGPRTDIVLALVREEIMLSQRNRIFLSHKSANKPLVRRFKATLSELGFQPWIDEEAGRAGDNLHRLLLDGMKSSCAAVFFITPDFRDELYLKEEIELALDEHTQRGERFRIITLRMTNEHGEQGVVPDILRRFIFAEPQSELEALNSILRGLPTRVGPIEWREGLKA